MAFKSDQQSEIGTVYALDHLATFGPYRNFLVSSQMVQARNLLPVWLRVPKWFGIKGFVQSFDLPMESKLRDCIDVQTLNLPTSVLFQNVQGTCRRPSTFALPLPLEPPLT